ncbi:MAG: DUF4238 domain-containing protein [Cyanobacteria bacterium P01_A01_bin.116]
MPRLKKKQHVIPKVYIKKWKDPSFTKHDRVFCPDKKTLASEDNGYSPDSRVFVEKHYFTEIEMDGERSHPTEDYLGEEVENKFNAVVREIESGQLLSENEQKYLWQFIKSMFARVSWMREPLQYLMKPALDRAKKASARKVIKKQSQGRSRAIRRKAKKTSYHREIVERVNNQSRATLQALQQSLLTKVHPIVVMAASDPDEIELYPYKIIRADCDLSFLSSDTPCFLEEDTSLLEFGLDDSTKRAFVCPLTPKLVFVGGLGLKTGYVDADADWVRRFNSRVRENSKKILISNTISIDESWFLKNPNAPPSMAETIRRIEWPGQKSRGRGFG